MIHSIMSDLLNTGQQGTLHLTSEFTRSLKLRRVIRGICERCARTGAAVTQLFLAGSFEIAEQRPWLRRLAASSLGAAGDGLWKPNPCVTHSFDLVGFT